jgi:putative ABC transport system ATP-binding protein
VIDPPVVELRGVGVRYRGRTGLEPLDLLAGPGELVTVTGRAGSGRTTLLRVVGLLTRPTMGRYLLNGTDTARLGDKGTAALRGRVIGSIFDQPCLLGARSAVDNVQLPLLYAAPPRRIRESLALAALDRVGLAHRASVPAGQLAAGERRLVVIARALAAGPDLLLCDDPTAGLDPPVGAMVTTLLAGLAAEGRTVLVATSDQLAAAYSSRCVRVGR